MKALKEKILSLIWDKDLATIPWWQAWPLAVIRLVHIMLVDFMDGQLNLRAMSLVFTTMLSIVPLIAVSFSVMKGFGVHNQLEPMMLNYLAPLGAQGKEIAQQIMGFVDNIKVGLLSGVGLGLLFWIIVRLINKIENAFNYTWRVQQSGSLARRFSNYLSVIMVGPILVFVAMGVTGSVINTTIAQTILSIEPFGTLLSITTKLIPYILIIAAFTFTYLFIPNTKVKLIPALTGGFAAGVLWQTVGWVFATVMSASISANYTAIYSSFAFLFVFMIWLWWSWLILLVGSSVAFYKQYPEYLFINTHDLSLTNRQKEELAMQIMTVIGQRFYNNVPSVTANELVEILHIPKLSIEQQLDLFVAHGLLVCDDSESPAYTPARPMEELTLKSVIDTVREPSPSHHVKSSLNSKFDVINSLLTKLDSQMNQVLGEVTVKDIAQKQGLLGKGSSDSAVTPISSRKSSNE